MTSLPMVGLGESLGDAVRRNPGRLKRPAVKASRLAENSDASETSPEPPSPIIAPSISEPTPAQKLRELRLRDEPLADILGPFHVVCRRCGALVKLSRKSMWDMAHWTTHRNRCVRRPDLEVEEARRKNFGYADPRRSISYPSTSQENAPFTPSLTPDTDAEVDVERLSASEEPPQTVPAACSPAPETRLWVRDLDPAFEVYVVRTRRAPTHAARLLDYRAARAWSWSCIRPPVFDTTFTSDFIDYQYDYSESEPDGSDVDSESDFESYDENEDYQLSPLSEMSNQYSDTYAYRRCPYGSPYTAYSDDD